MSAYVVRWIPIGPEIKVACQTYDEAVAIRDELCAIGRLESVTIEKDGQILTEDFISRGVISDCIDHIKTNKEETDAADLSALNVPTHILQ